MAMITWPQLERWFCYLLGFIHMTLGVAVLVGGTHRFPPPNYSPLLEFTNGRVWPYGVLWISGGAIMILARGGWRLIGIGLVVLISNLWAALFFVATQESALASYTPVAAYGGYGLINAVLFWLTYMHLRWKNEDD